MRLVEHNLIRRGESVRDLLEKVRKRRLERLESRLSWTKKEMRLKADIQESSHSLLWVWEFSKKVVLICFLFYIATQLYAMTVMALQSDFSHLGELITQSGEIMRDCVFAYFIKAGVENVVNIAASRILEKSNKLNISDNETVG